MKDEILNVKTNEHMRIVFDKRCNAGQVMLNMATDMEDTQTVCFE